MKNKKNSKKALYNILELEEYKTKLEKMQNMITFFNNASKVYLGVVKDSGVKIYYETRLKEYNDSIDFLNKESNKLKAKIDKFEIKSKEKNKSNVADGNKLDSLMFLNQVDLLKALPLLGLTNEDKKQINKNVDKIMNIYDGKNRYGSASRKIDLENQIIRNHKICKIKKLEDFLVNNKYEGKKAPVLTEEEKDEYLVFLDRLCKEGELELSKDEYQVYLDKLTREGCEIVREKCDKNTSDKPQEIKQKIENRKKSKLLLEIEEVYAEEMEKHKEEQM